MKVFITGGTGNIGQYVTLAVTGNGHEAVVLSRNPEKYPSLAQKARLVKGTITDYALLTDYVQGCDAVIHIALGWDNEPVSMKRNIIRPDYTYSNPPFPDGSSQADARFRDIADAVVNSKPETLTKHDGTQLFLRPKLRSCT
jgi:NAD(P)-dependent dehydrogenase (short-subunit alcohol dehydrogenase family)